jgi:hypothetical protein
VRSRTRIPWEPSPELVRRVRDECYEELLTLPRERILEMAPPVGAFSISIEGGPQPVQDGRWVLQAAPMGWRSGSDHVFVVVGVTATWWWLPFRWTSTERAFGFDSAGHPYEVAEDAIYDVLPAP